MHHLFCTSRICQRGSSSGFYHHPSSLRYGSVCVFVLVPAGALNPWKGTTHVQKMRLRIVHSHAETTDPPGGGRPLDYVGTTNATPFGNRFRLRNRTIVRRDGGIADRTNTCIFVIFEKAAWWAGPIGILRCRVTQRRQLRIFDVPRAGAVLKARATSPNSVWWHLPEGVCGFCLARYHETDDPNDPGNCFWCSDTTLCPNCVIPITIALNDPRVSAICQERARYDQRTAFMMRDPFRKRRLHICQNCASCDNVLDREAISRHWPREYQRL